MRPIEVTSSGTVPVPLAPGVQHLRAALDREEQDSGVQLPDRVEGHLQRGHHADAAAAPDRPEQVGLAVGVRPYEMAVGGHDLGRGHAVGGEPVTAGQPADPAAEGVAGHAHVRRGARQRGQAVLPGRYRHVLPLGARTGPGGTGRGIDIHPPHARCPEQHCVPQRLERLGAAAGALRRDPHPLRAGEPDRLHHVGGGLGHHDGSRPLVHGQVPRPTRRVIASVAGDENVAGDGGPQRFRGAGHDIRGVHCFLLVNAAVG
jgi:hypothetical protein